MSGSTRTPTHQSSVRVAMRSPDVVQTLADQDGLFSLTIRGATPTAPRVIGAIRGLMIDKPHGNVLKMDRYKFVGRAWHGLRELSRDERRELYQIGRAHV